MTDTLLAHAIETVTGDPSYRTAAQKISQLIQNEQGIEQAITAIEQIQQEHLD